MATLLYQGHGSFRITTDSGYVIYVDPYAGEGYEAGADLILVTHGHGDHSQVDMPARKPSCRVITYAEAHVNGAYHSFDLGEAHIEAVEAYNTKHSADSCVGYIITVDGKTVYAAGDTSKTAHMAGFAARALDWAFLPCDGVYNMDLDEASECAALINAKNSVPIHMKPGALFDIERAGRFTAPNRVIVEPGETVVL